jgi:hypothetical protein
MHNITKRIAVSLTMVVAAICFSVVGFGQDFASIRDKAKQAVEKKWPDMELVSKDEQENQAVYNWGAARNGLRILIFYGESKEEAAKRMDFVNSYITVGHGKKLTDLGDEAYLQITGRGDFAYLRFRKANVYVEVGAPTLAMADELARDLEKLIRARGKKGR